MNTESVVTLAVALTHFEVREALKTSIGTFGVQNLIKEILKDLPEVKNDDIVTELEYLLLNPSMI